MDRQNSMTIPRVLARVVATFGVVAALSACIGGTTESAPPISAEPFRPLPGPEGIITRSGDIDYFPHRFPIIQGEIEALPAQF